MKKNHLSLAIFLTIFIILPFISSCTAFMGIASDGPIVEDYGQRTAGTKLEDKHISSKTKININRHNETLNKSQIQIKAFNKVVLLTGQVPDETHKKLAADIASKVREVRRVHNEIEVAGPISFLARTNDAFLSTKVKTRLIASNDVDAGRVEYIVENGKLYLMGLTTQDEATRIVAAAQKVSGIQKIIKVFEYISAETP